MHASCSPWSPTHFLASAWPREHVALASYPRSGNSFTRAALEAITGVWTGSDFCRQDEDVRDGNYNGWSQGEGRTDASVWVVKTHSIFTTGGPFAPFSAGRVILLCRNPLQAIFQLQRPTSLFLPPLSLPAPCSAPPPAPCSQQSCFQQPQLPASRSLPTAHCSCFLSTACGYLLRR